MWKFDSTPCITAAVRSRPMPVSMFLLGSGCRLLGGSPYAVELREHQVPNLDRAEGRLAVDFAARAANAVGALAGGVGRPEVLVLAEPLEPIRRQLDLVQPDVGRLVVVEIDRGRELFRDRAAAISCRSKTPMPNGSRRA